MRKVTVIESAEELVAMLLAKRDILSNHATIEDPFPDGAAVAINSDDDNVKIDDCEAMEVETGITIDELLKAFITACGAKVKLI